MRHADAVLVTPRLRLRRARAEDLDAFHEVLSDAVAMRWWATPPHESLDQTRAWLNDMIASSPEVSEDFAIEYEGAVIGKVGAYRLPEFGYILRRDCWGKGLALEALRAWLKHAFSRPDVSVLRTDVDPRNTASLKLMEKLGFAETGRAERTWFISGEWCNSVYYALEREAWLAGERSEHLVP